MLHCTQVAVSMSCTVYAMAVATLTPVKVAAMRDTGQAVAMKDAFQIGSKLVSMHADLFTSLVLLP